MGIELELAVPAQALNNSPLTQDAIIFLKKLPKRQTFHSATSKHVFK